MTEQKQYFVSWEIDIWADSPQQAAELEKISALEKFLEFGKQTYLTAHKGYFSGYGFAARVLRSMLKDLVNSPSNAGEGQKRK